MQTYRTKLVDNSTGTATFGIVELQTEAGWRLIGRTKEYRTYPRSVRARTAAISLARTHAKWPSLALVQAGGMQVIEI